MVKFKVVTKDRRSCTCVNYPEFGFALTYEQNEIVTAPKWSIGIAVFNTKKDAENFMGEFIPCSRKELIILRVEPIGRGKKPKRVLSSDTIPEYQFRKYTPLLFSNDKVLDIIYNTWPVPKGSMFYPAVKVLN